MKRWGAAGRKPVIAGGNKLNLSLADRCDLNRCQSRRGDGGKAGEHQVLLDLSDQAVMIGALSILVQQVVKLGRHREGKRADPQEEHQAGDSKPAAPARML